MFSIYRRVFTPLAAALLVVSLGVGCSPIQTPLAVAAGVVSSRDTGSLSEEQVREITAEYVDTGFAELNADLESSWVRYNDSVEAERAEIARMLAEFDNDIMKVVNQRIEGRVPEIVAEEIDPVMGQVEGSLADVLLLYREQAKEFRAEIDQTLLGFSADTLTAVDQKFAEFFCSLDYLHFTTWYALYAPDGPLGARNRESRHLTT